MKTLLLLTALGFTPLLLATEVGKLVVVKGEVSVISADGAQRAGEPLVVLSEGDKVQTGGKGYVKILMNDDSVFQVGPNSQFELEKFVMKTKNERTAVYSLAKGQLRSWFVHKAPDKTLTIKTPTASMGVRGTEILTDVYRSGGGETKTDIALIRGKLEVASAAIGGRVMLEPGQLLDGLGSRLAGRAPASAREALLKRLPSKVFDAVRKNSVGPSGTIFLHEARQKFGQEKVNEKIFGAIEEKRLERAPASIASERVQKRKVQNEQVEIREKLVNQIDTDTRQKIQQQIVTNQAAKVSSDQDSKEYTGEDTGSKNIDSSISDNSSDQDVIVNTRPGIILPIGEDNSNNNGRLPASKPQEINRKTRGAIFNFLDNGRK